MPQATTAPSARTSPAASSTSHAASSSRKTRFSPRRLPGARRVHRHARGPDPRPHARAGPLPHAPPLRRRNRRPQLLGPRGGHRGRGPRGGGRRPARRRPGPSHRGSPRPHRVHARRAHHHGAPVPCPAPRRVPERARGLAAPLPRGRPCVVVPRAIPAVPRSVRRGREGRGQRKRWCQPGFRPNRPAGQRLHTCRGRGRRPRYRTARREPPDAQLADADDPSGRTPQPAGSDYRDGMSDGADGPDADARDARQAMAAGATDLTPPRVPQAPGQQPEDAPRPEGPSARDARTRRRRLGAARRSPSASTCRRSRARGAPSWGASWASSR